MSPNLRDKQNMLISIRVTNDHQKRKSKNLINIIFAVIFFSHLIHGLGGISTRNSKNLINHPEALMGGAR